MASPYEKYKYQPSMDQLARPPQRMSIVDLSRRIKTSQESPQEDTLIAQFNPDQFAEDLKVAWAQLESPGLSHRPLHYTGTENTQVSFELIFDSTLNGQTKEGLLRARRFLRSLCYAKAGARSVAEGQAPRVLFVWPNFITLTSVVRDLGFLYESFDLDGTPVRFKARLQLEQIRDFRTYSEEVLEQD